MKQKILDLRDFKITKRQKLGGLMFLGRERDGLFLFFYNQYFTFLLKKYLFGYLMYTKNTRDFIKLKCF
jgi:hypothetical protein